MLKALVEIESIIAILKVKVYELEKDNQKLKKQIKLVNDELRKIKVLDF